MYRKGALVSVSVLAQLAAAGLYPGISKENHTCVLCALWSPTSTTRKKAKS